MRDYLAENLNNKNEYLRNTDPEKVKITKLG